MLRIETDDRRTAERVWAYLDAAGFRCTDPLPTIGLGCWSVVVSGPSSDRDTVFRALPSYLRRGLAFSQLEGKEGR